MATEIVMQQNQLTEFLGCCAQVHHWRVEELVEALKLVEKQELPQESVDRLVELTGEAEGSLLVVLEESGYLVVDQKSNLEQSVEGQETTDD